MWNLPPPAGFQGLREDLPLEVYVRHLPHWRQEGATYFVTFRLADSLPQVKLDELATLRREWERAHPPPRSKEALEQLTRQVVVRVERWLDQGMGGCVLRNPPAAAPVQEALLHFDGTRYDLGAFVVMPNHVHALVRPLACREYPLDTVVGGWKQFSSTRINECIGAKGKRGKMKATTASSEMPSICIGACSTSGATRGEPAWSARRVVCGSNRNGWRPAGRLKQNNGVGRASQPVRATDGLGRPSHGERRTGFPARPGPGRPGKAVLRQASIGDSS